MNIYPFPTLCWVEKYALLTSDLTRKALTLGLILPRDQNKATGHQLDDVEYDDDVPLTEQERLDLRDAVFPVLLLFLYTTWFSTSRPRAALENLVLDFRDVPTVYAAEEDLLGFVAGMSERHSETERELLIGRIETHRRLYKFLQHYVRSMYPAEFL